MKTKLQIQFGKTTASLGLISISLTAGFVAQAAPNTATTLNCKTLIENKDSRYQVVPGLGGSCLVIRKPGAPEADLEGDTLLVQSNGQQTRIGDVSYAASPTAKGAVMVRMVEDSGTKMEVVSWDSASGKLKVCTTKKEDLINVASIKSGTVKVTTALGLIRVSHTEQQVSKDYVQDCDAKGFSKTYVELDEKDRKILQSFGSGADSNELTNPVRAASLSDVIGREGEMNQLMANLQMTNLRSTLVIGKPGAGKTSLVYALAKRISEGRVPDALKGWSIYSIELTKLGDEGLKGKADGKMAQLLDASVGKKVILLMDEIHKLVGKGSSGDSSSDITETMKTPLAEGRLSIIGTTTDDKNEIGQLRLKKAFMERFNQMTLQELSPENIVKILRNKANEMEMRYKVAFSDQNLKDILSLTKRYTPDLGQPRIGLQIVENVATNLFHEIEKKNSTTPTVTTADIENQIGIQANIPSLINKVDANTCRGMTFKDKVKSFEQDMRKDFIGHPEAIRTVQGTLNSIALHKNNPKRPAGVFMFLGPSGVGKTYFGEVLAKKFCLPHKQFAMSKYKDKSSVDSLTGAGPSYVGYHAAGGEVTQWIKENPESVIVFDEIDKASPEVHEALIQLLDDGVFHDKVGNEAKFRNGFIILTANFGMDLVDVYDKNVLKLKDNHAGAYSKPLPTTVPKDEVSLKNEILNQMSSDGKFGTYMSGRVGRDNTIIFHHLNQAESKQVAALEIKKVKKEIEDGFKITVDPEIEAMIGNESYDFQIGARRARELADTWIRQSVTKAIMKNGENEMPKEIAIVSTLPKAEKPGTLSVVPEELALGTYKAREDDKQGICRGRDFAELVRTFPTEVREKYIGQGSGVESVTTALRRLAVLERAPGRAVGRFLFLGPSGVGKTYLGELVSDMFCLPKKVFPMEMYKEKDSINTFAGAAPSYTGYNPAGGDLVQWVRANPNSVLIFDEIDKADPGVLSALMQFFENGTITDKSGQTARLEGGMIFLTSNFAMELIDDYDKLVTGIEDPKNPKTNFDPNLIPRDLESLRTMISQLLVKDKALASYMQGRIGKDNIIVFNHLKPEEIAQIASIEINKALKSVPARFKVKTDNSVQKYVIKEGVDFMTGARQIRDVAQRVVLDTIADYLISLNSEERKLEREIIISDRDLSVPEGTTLLRIKRLH